MAHRSLDTAPARVLECMSSSNTPPCANWDSHSTWLFCSISACVIREGFVDGHTPTKSGWKKIMTELNEVAGRRWTKKQLFNKSQHLRKHYCIWKCIVESATGIGWDPITGTVMANPEWWEAGIWRHLELKMLWEGSIPLLG